MKNIKWYLKKTHVPYLHTYALEIHPPGGGPKGKTPTRLPPAVLKVFNKFLDSYIFISSNIQPSILQD